MPKTSEFCKDAARHELKIGDKKYPKCLLSLKDPPKKLYVIGNVSALSSGISIVGARKATPYGLNCARHFASLAVKYGVTVFSGGAIGCDQSAHKGALSNGGKTVAIFGSGADVVYPIRGKALFEEMVLSGGAVISELPWKTEPQKWAFRKRNRLIAAFGKAVLIVEAGFPSGTFSTADYAIETNREVLVVPGSILSKESYGSNRLLADGATAIIDDESFEVAMSRAFVGKNHAKRKGLSLNVASIPACKDVHLRMLDAMAASPLSPDDLIDIGGKTAIEVLKNLSSLEMMGLVAKYPDGRFGVTGEYQ